MNLALPENSGKIDLFYKLKGLLEADIEIALLPLMLRQSNLANFFFQELYEYHFVRALILYSLCSGCEEARKQGSSS